MIAHFYALKNVFHFYALLKKFLLFYALKKNVMVRRSQTQFNLDRINVWNIPSLINRAKVIQPVWLFQSARNSLNARKYCKSPFKRTTIFQNFTHFCRGMNALIIRFSSWPIATWEDRRVLVCEHEIPGDVNNQHRHCMASLSCSKRRIII